MTRVVTKMRSDLVDQMEAPIDRASLLAHATLFDGKPDRVNRIPTELAGVTPDEVKSFAQKYLVASNRTVIERDPVANSGNEADKKPGGAAMKTFAGLLAIVALYSSRFWTGGEDPFVACRFALGGTAESGSFAAS